MSLARTLFVGNRAFSAIRADSAVIADVGEVG